jgi:hypothetical protein
LCDRRRRRGDAAISDIQKLFPKYLSMARIPGSFGASASAKVARVCRSRSPRLSVDYVGINRHRRCEPVEAAHPLRVDHAIGSGPGGANRDRRSTRYDLAAISASLRPAVGVVLARGCRRITCATRRTSRTPPRICMSARGQIVRLIAMRRAVGTAQAQMVAVLRVYQSDPDREGVGRSPASGKRGIQGRRWSPRSQEGLQVRRFQAVARQQPPA